MITEVGAQARNRTLNLRPGRYFVRARGTDVIHEGPVDLAAGTSSVVALDELERIEYARLVRKGGVGRTHAHAIELGGQAALPMVNSESACIGASVGYALDMHTLGVRGRLGMCTADSEGLRVETRLMAYGLEARVYHTWDFGPLSVELGVGPGLTVFTQRFETRGQAPSRAALSPLFAVGSNVAFALAAGYYVAADAAAETHLLRLRDDAASEPHSRVDFTLRTRLIVGRRF